MAAVMLVLLLAGHDVQTEAFCAANVPSPHEVQALLLGAPEIAENVPAGQSRHVLDAEAPRVALYDPGVQAVHALLSDAPVTIE